LTPYLVNPQGLKLFSAAEMDQTWTKPLYQINVPLGFYWGALSGLNTGLSVWLVTQSALQEAQLKPELHSIFKMFNNLSSKIVNPKIKYEVICNVKHISLQYLKSTLTSMETRKELYQKGIESAKEFVTLHH
jgi:hypothetical protein